MSSSFELVHTSASVRLTRPTSDARAPSLDHLLVCLDRSALSDACLPWARFIAEAFRSKVTLLHVLPSPPVAHGRPDALDWELAQREATHYLAAAQTSLRDASDQVVTRLEQGAPARRIVAVAREPDIDLTIIAAHGAGGENAPDLGSIAQHVLAFAAGSVLLAQANEPAHVPPRRILVPLDGSLRSESVLPIVVGLARRQSAEVVLVHVVRDPTASAVPSDADDMRVASTLAARIEANAEAYLGRIRARLLLQLGVVEVLVVRRPEERQALLDIAREQRADLLVVSAHGSTCNIDSAFGSVASYALTTSKISTFVLQDLPRGQRRLAPEGATRQSRPPERA